MQVVRIVIADDHPLIRDGVRAVLTCFPDIELIGEASTGEQAVMLAATLRPDVVVMDIKMPGIGGIEATRRITDAVPEIGVLVVTMFDDDESVFEAMRAGARGYMLKGLDGADMVRAIREVHRGEAVVSPAIARRLISFFSTPKPVAPTEAFPQLTDRECQVLALIAEHQTNGEIAARLELSSKTVRNHVSNIFGKLQVAGRAEAIARAREAGMGLAG